MIMKRRIIQIRDSTQLVSLPREWCKAMNLKKGDEIDVNVQDDAIILSKEFKPKASKAEIDVSGSKEGVILNILRELYEGGFDEIVVKFSSPKTTNKFNRRVDIIQTVEDFTTKMTGMEIVKKSNNMIFLKEVSLSNPEETDELINRMLWTLVDYMQEFQKAINENDVSELSSTFVQYERILNRQTNYCMRILSKNRYKELVKTSYLMQFVRNIEEIGDKIADMSEEISADNIPIKELKPVVKDLKDIITYFADIARSFRKEIVDKIYEIKVRVKYGIKTRNKKSYKLMCELVDIVEESSYLLWVMHMHELTSAQAS